MVFVTVAEIHIDARTGGGGGQPIGRRDPAAPVYDDVRGAAPGVP